MRVGQAGAERPVLFDASGTAWDFTPLTVNGESRQDGHTKNMIFDVRHARAQA